MKKYIRPFLIILLLAIAGGATFWLVYSKFFAEDAYYAFFLRTGDLYFGKLDSPLSTTLANPWLLVSDGKGGFSLAPMKNAVWNPTNPISFNPDDIVFWSKLDADSSLVKAMKGESIPSGMPPMPQDSLNSQQEGRDLQKDAEQTPEQKK